MSYIKKLLIVVLLFIFINIPVKATAIPEYEERFVELRGAWVSTIGNLDIGKQYSIEQYKSQYQNVLDNFEKLNMNAVFFQTRPANDAFYESEINPWSAYLVGPQGEDPGWDPLPWLIEETHKQTGMQVVILVDEYDKPLLETLENPELLEDNRKTMKAFFGVIKSEDAQIGRAHV